MPEGGSLDIATDHKEVYSYLLTLRRGRQRIIYCQMPIADDYIQNPTSGIMMRNLIRFADMEYAPDKSFIKPEEKE